MVDAETTGTVQVSSQETTHLEAAFETRDEVKTQSNTDECTDESERNLMSHQAMPELGKRSAVARAKRKAAILKGAQAAT